MILLVACPSVARATTVSRLTHGTSVSVEIVDAEAAPDRLDVAGSSTAGVMVTKTGGTAQLTAGSGCTQTTQNVVTCSGPAGNLVADLGAGDDILVDHTDLHSTLSGGLGRDQLTLGTGGGTVSGGPDADQVRNGDPNGSARTVELFGDDGDDLIDLSGNPLGPDTARGGPGVDSATYFAFGRAGPVTVTIDDVANDGSPGEGDNVLSDVENLIGSQGSDTLTGSALANDISGGFGSDTLNGLGGNDVLHGGGGDDTEFGGDGDDTLGGPLPQLAAQDAGKDTFRGEGGFDVLNTADGVADNVIDCGLILGAPVSQALGGKAAVDLVDPRPANCQSDQRAPKDEHPTVQVSARSVRVRHGVVRLRLSCPRATPGHRCAGALAAVKGRRTLARGRYRLRAGRSRTLKLRLRRAARGRIEVRTLERDRRGRPRTTRTRVFLLRTGRPARS